MAAQGNTNAMKYTEAEAIAVIEQAIELIQDDTATLTQHHAFNKLHISRGLINYWKKDRFSKSELVLDAIKRLGWDAEEKLLMSGYDGLVPPNLCIFGSKAIHGLVEKGVDDQNKSFKSLLTFESVPVKKAK